MVCPWFTVVAATTVGQNDQTLLHQLRTQRRAQHRELQLSPDKSDGPAPFGLLVIPVDFSDTRLPAGWDAATELNAGLLQPESESLRHYYQVASRNQVDLRITTAPLIHLPLTRREYSDVGYQGFSRSRQLATEALLAVRALGLEFRSLDMDGPDGRPGTADDDGEIDGVLILHSGPGQENDAQNGLIQPLQFFLEDPVISGGIRASFYAVASLQSGPGIWAHETGHLLGMEDRYDPLLHPNPQGADVRSLGGLGRFSLMASGAWGTGDGYGAALPDAYTSWQMGWASEILLPEAGSPATTLRPGQVGRIWTRGEIGSEYFLVETRDPTSSAPFDAMVPAHQLLVYHVDESIPEGNWTVDGPGQWHLRVNLVEADANGALAAGDDDGSPADLFPGPLGVDSFGPDTTPNSWGYRGNSYVSLEEITSGQGQVSFQASAALEPAFLVDLELTSGLEAILELTARNVGVPVPSATITLKVTGGTLSGSFEGTSSLVTRDLVATVPGSWTLANALSFQLDRLPVPGDFTVFTYTIATDDWTSAAQIRHWVWADQDQALDFASDWPGAWSVEDVTQGTTWHRWVGPPFLDQREQPILVATGQDFPDPTSWPGMTYTNRGHTRLTSGELGPGTQFVRLVHALGTEKLATGEAMDAGRVRWVGPDGRLEIATPLGGYPTSVSTAAVNPLAGQAAFADSLLLDETGAVIWHVDRFPLPDVPGPWRLQLEFASNTLWRRQGWLVADLQAESLPTELEPFPVTWSLTQGLEGSWLHEDLPSSEFRIQTLTPETGTWETLRNGLDGPRISPADLQAMLGPSGPRRHQVRMLAHTPLGPVASRSVVIYLDGGHQAASTLSPPRPNPARDRVSVQVDIPEGSSAQLSIYDVRGRLLHRRDCPQGVHLLVWEGTDDRGRRCPAGVYFLRLEGSRPSVTRKVVLLH
jgi:M6 family metalloprotease-like protein